MKPKRDRLRRIGEKILTGRGNGKIGGELGYFTEKKMDPTFSKAAFSLKPGEISGLVQTPFGLHIIKVEDVREAKSSRSRK